MIKCIYFIIIHWTIIESIGNFIVIAIDKVEVTDEPNVNIWA